MSRPSVVIVSPAAPDANNGNGRTAARWHAWLAPHWDVRVTCAWPDGRHAADRAMLALHARRSADAVRAWAQAHPGSGLAVVLTGTDLYRDCLQDGPAQQSLALAQRLVVLQAQAPEALPPAMRSKVRVIFQSAPASPARGKPAGWLQAVMVGHLRDVKDPRTLFAAARLLAGEAAIRIDHIGGGELDPALAAEAEATQRACASYRWLGALSHEETLARIAQAHVLVHTSLLEGGAHVVLEAVQCGTPVLASRVPGNVGMLGEDYGGYFPAGDAGRLAGLLLECRRTQGDPEGGLLGRLRAQCARRSPLFAPESEAAALRALVQELLIPP